MQTLKLLVVTRLVPRTLLVALSCCACVAGTVVADEAVPTTPAPVAVPTVTPSPSSPNQAQGAPAFDPNELQGSAVLGPGAAAPLVALRTSIEAAAAASGVSASVLGAVIWAESRGDVHAAGGGLMQIGSNEFAAEQAAHPQINGASSDADANVLAGAFYLVELQSVMQSKYGRSDLGITLRAYNSGEQGVDPNDLARLPAGTGSSVYVTNVTSYNAIIATGSGTLPP